MKIGIDIDGVITDFVRTFQEVVREKYKVELPEEQIREHDLYKVLGIPVEELRELVMKVFPQDLKPQLKAVETIQKLAEKHQIYIITAREPETMDLSETWLNNHNVPRERLAFIKEGDKHKFIEEHNLDIVIDDNLKEIANWIGVVPNILVFDHPWNQSLNINNSFVRVKNWDEILQIIEKLE